MLPASMGHRQAFHSQFGQSVDDEQDHALGSGRFGSGDGRRVNRQETDAKQEGERHHPASAKDCLCKRPKSRTDKHVPKPLVLRSVQGFNSQK